MVTISLREFRLKANKYLGDLPVTLTVYNIPKYKIVSVNEKVVLTDKSGSPTESVNAKKEALKKVEKEVREIEDSFSRVRSVPKPPVPKKKKMGF